MPIKPSFLCVVLGGVICLWPCRGPHSSRTATTKTTTSRRKRSPTANLLHSLARSLIPETIRPFLAFKHNNSNSKSSTGTSAVAVPLSFPVNAVWFSSIGKQARSIGAYGDDHISSPGTTTTTNFWWVGGKFHPYMRRMNK